MSDSNHQTQETPQGGSVFNMHWNEASEVTQTAAYRTISMPAIVTLFLGLLSLTTLIHWGFGFFAIAAVVFAFISLYLIKKSDGARFGASLAYTGLFFAVFSVTVYVTLWQTYQYDITSQSIPFAKSYLELVTSAKNNPNVDIAVISDYSNPYWSRNIQGPEVLWKRLESNEFGQEEMQAKSQDICLRTLMALGDQAKISFYQVKNYSFIPGASEQVISTFAVTYPGKDGTETFFVDVTAQRYQKPQNTTEEKKQGKRSGWGIVGCKAPVLPKEFGGQS